MRQIRKSVVAVAIALGTGLGSAAVVSAATPAPQVTVQHDSMRGPKQNMSAIADLLGMTVPELQTQLRVGKSLAQVAAAQSVDVSKVIDLLVSEARTRITEMVNSAPPVKSATGRGFRGGRLGMRG